MGGAAKREYERIVTMVNGFSKEWAGKNNSLQAQVDNIRSGVNSIVAGVAQNLAGVKANLDANGDALEQFDIFNQIWAKLFMKLSERMAQTDYLLAGGKQVADLNEQDLVCIKERAKEWFDATFQAMKAEVTEEREAYIKELRAKAAEIQAEQEKAAKEEERAKKEEQVAESTLRGAEQNLSTPGGQGSEIPAGAEIFGG